MERHPDERNILFRTLRQMVDMSLKDVSAISGISVSRLSDFERGKMILSTSQQKELARILADKMKPDYRRARGILAGLTDEPAEKIIRRLRDNDERPLVTDDPLDYLDK